MLLLLAGPVRTISPEVRLRVGPSRVVSARAGARDGVRALGLAFLADTGRLEAADDPSPSPGGGWRPLAVLAPEARAWADGIREQLRPLGGLNAVLRPSEVRPSALEAAPEVVQQVARLLDGRRTAARVLADAGVDELLTARILARLVADGVAEVLGPDDDADPLLPPPRAESAQFTMPRSGWGQTSALPEADADEFEGAAVADDLRHWLAEEGAPETLLSDAAFQGAYVGPLSPTPSQAPTQAPPPSGPPAAPLPPVITALPPAAPVPEVAPPPAPTPAPQDPTPPPVPAQPPRGGSEVAARVRAQVAYSTRGPGPAEDEDVFRDAGVGQSRSTWVVGAVVLVVALAAAIALLRG